MWNFKKEIFKSRYNASPDIGCQCFILTSFAVDIEQPHVGATQFRYIDCETNMEITPPPVPNDTSISVCAGRTPAIIGGDPGMVSLSGTNCCNIGEPAECSYTEWSGWGECVEQLGQQGRTREVISGIGCEDTVEFQYCDPNLP